MLQLRILGMLGHMAIYTKTGDKGQTSLSNGKRVNKSDPIIEVYGQIDELSSAIGVAISKTKNLKLKTDLRKVQNDLFSVGSSLFSQDEKYLGGRIKEFENLIDEFTKDIPKLNHFILPGGGEAGSTLHLARAICRRAERGVVRLKQKIEVDEIMIAYLNRLSDLLFTMARFINYKENKKEIVWQNK